MSEQWFQALLHRLLKKYCMTCDGIDSQHTTVDEGIALLQEKEAQLKAEMVLWARSQRDDEWVWGHCSQWDTRYDFKWASSQDSDFFSQHKSFSCFLCSRTHCMHNCKYASVAKWAVQSVICSEKSSKSTAVNSWWQMFKHDWKRHKTFDAETDEKSDFQLSESSFENENESDEKIAALSKKIISKIPRSYWVTDSDVFSHMTDQLWLFRDSLMQICWVIIKVREERLYVNYCSTVTMQDQTGNFILLYYILYVPKLEINLLSEKQMCKKGLWGSFNTWELYMHNENDKLVLETPQKDDVYVVKHIAKRLDEFALSAMCQWCEHETACSSQVTELMGPDLSVQNVNCDQEFFMLDMQNQSLAFLMPGTLNHDSADEDNCNHTDSRDHKIKMYELWHWHFVHLDSAKLCNLHKVMTLSQSILIVKEKDHVCEVCALTKFRNKRGHQVSERKTAILNLVSIDICGPLPLSYTDYSYLLKIVDNHLWKIWTILLKHQSDAPQTLKEWWLKTKLQSEAKVQAVCSDNVTELKITLDQWCAFFRVTPQYTVLHMLIQNGVAEWAIQITENSVHTMIKETELSIKFWVQAVETDVYLHNHTAIRLIIDGQATTSEKTFTEAKSFIDYIHVWECKCYFFVDPKSLSARDRQDKCMNHERVRVFMSYVDEITKQYQLWAPDLKCIIRSHAVKFAENEKRESVNLRLQRQTSNTLSEWKLVEQPWKEDLTALSEHFILQSFFMSGMNNPPVLTEISTASKETELTDSNSWVWDVSAECSKEISTSETTVLCESADCKFKMVKQFLWVEIPKRQQKNDDFNLNKSATKMLKTMLALTALETDNAQSIPTSLTYVKAVEDSVWEEMWKNAIKAELTTLAANDTWKEIISLKNVNIITSKWVFKSKLHINSTLNKLKARVVTRDFSQMHSIDYENIFASTVKFDTLHVFLTLVALENLKCHQMDVNNAFTESFLKKTIYMTSFSDVEVASNCALHIMWSPYELKQAARDWHEWCVVKLVKIEFHQSNADLCLLLHSQKDIMLLLYVDDIVIASTATSAVT